MTFFDCTADLVGQLNGNGQKGMLQIDAPPCRKFLPTPLAHTHCASVHQAAKLVAALLRVSGVTAGLAESNGSLHDSSWWRGTVVERRSLAGELSLSCARPVADG